jgi:hypothetical protein
MDLNELIDGADAAVVIRGEKILVFGVCQCPNCMRELAVELRAAAERVELGAAAMAEVAEDEAREVAVVH